MLRALSKLFCPSTFLLPLFFFLTGCMAEIRPTGHLEEGYTGFNEVEESWLKVRLDEDARHDNQPVASRSDNVTTQPTVFIVPEPQWAAPVAWEGEPERREKIIFTVRERLYRYLLRNYPHPVRVRYAIRQSDPIMRDHYILTITARVTDYRKGIGALRYLIGSGFGQAYIQIEGEFLEGKEQRKIGEYAVRRGHSAYSQSGLNLSVLRSDYAMLYAADEALAEFTERLPGIFPGVRVLPAPDQSLETDRKSGPSGKSVSTESEE